MLFWVQYTSIPLLLFKWKYPTNFNTKNTPNAGNIENKVRFLLEMGQTQYY